MREAKSQELYQAAVAQAWGAIQARLQQLVTASLGQKLQLVELSYDPMPGQSLIEELPDQPKSSRPQAVEVSVRLRATYTLR